MTNKFKVALDAVNDGVLRGEDFDTIRQALTICQRLMEEPSEEMLQAGTGANVGPRSSAHNYIFRAMVEQLMREVDNAER